MLIRDIYAFDNAPKCGAKNKNNEGKPCHCPAIKGKARCRVHGGAKGSGAPRYNVNALRHGAKTIKVKAFRREIRNVIQHYKKFINVFGMKTNFTWLEPIKIQAK